MQAMIRFIMVGLVCGLAGAVTAQSTRPSSAPAKGDSRMELGNFSVSLAVKDLGASRAFYEKLGFRVVFGSEAARFLILQNDTATIGIFEGMFDKNILTFNPGWDRNTKTLPEFQDVREIQRTLEGRDIKLTTKA